jgi:hypothetical protein
MPFQAFIDTTNTTIAALSDNTSWAIVAPLRAAAADVCNLTIHY